MNFFSNTRPGKSVTYNSATFDLPVLYFRDDFFGLYFACSYKKAMDIMPSDNLYPLMLPNGKAMFGICAYNYRDTTVGSYGEVPTGIPCVHNEKLSRFSSLMPLMKESNYPGFGFLVKDLPVTKVLARDAGRGEWGYAKFIADMRFRITPEYFGCIMDDSGSRILEIRVPRRGFTMRDDHPLTTYSVKDHQLIRTVVRQTGVRHLSLNTKDAFVSFGNHPMAESIKALELSPKPFVSFYYTERSSILPSGEVVEKNIRAFGGYIGETREAIHETLYTDGDV